MPRFLTISPTHIPGKKEYAWQNCLRGGHVAIGWVHQDLKGKSWPEVESIIHSYHYANETSAIDAYRKFLALRPGDYVAVNNANHGLFGIGVVPPLDAKGLLEDLPSSCRFQLYGHDTGATEKEQWYSQLVGVEWRRTTYARRRDLLREGEKGWAPYGTTGMLLDEVPAYVLRALGEQTSTVPESGAPSQPLVYVRPDWLEPLLGTIESLRKDPNHQERAHESLVEDFLVALGYRKHEDIKYRQGRIDITVETNGKLLILFEVKRDWDLDYTRMDVVRQAYGYALERGIRYVAITNGNYYLVRDRLKGLSYETQCPGRVHAVRAPR